MFKPRHPAEVAFSVATIVTVVLCMASTASAQCGDPQAGECCTANGTPACEDQECCDAICFVDPFCCNAPWDEICAEEAGELCSICGAACGAPDAGSCCDANPTPGCEDTICCATVCLIASNCCVGEWNEGCADIAEAWCLALCCPEDINGDGQVGPFDLALLLGEWGPTSDGPADLDGDGAVGPFDLALLLFAWGTCG